ncbi:hypothetical protein [Bosea sp. BIWAKO-01]|uniref:hypothetical protein n=1 Tax=Bosea sp. BIWAKO-01 TaxID=506668 RepID=UPI000852AA3E|nr:hypothetical protein [Bosea sp. BIWAKO-01]GAU86570.1 hypothetical protein BIWAKO_06518 [Bosea sp. BIWAKO-01]
MAVFPTETDVSIAVAPAPSSYLEWAPILAGAVLAAAISSIMTAFGSAIGLSLVSAEPSRSSSLTVLGIAAALWALWGTVSACIAGGYVAGRMRRPVPDATAHEREMRDGAHGLLVWATGVLLLAFIATSSAVGAGRTALEGAAAATSGATSLLKLQQDPLGSALDGILRAPGAGAPVTPEERSELSRLMATAMVNGTLDPADRDYIATRMASRAGIGKPEAEKRVDDALAKLNQAKETAKQAAEKARKVGIISAFLTAAVLLVGAAAGWFGAVLGGGHRDEQREMPGWGRRRL